MKLYKIANEILDAIDAVDGMDVQEFEKTLQRFNERSDEIISYCLNLQENASTIERHCAELTVKRIAMEKKAERILEYVKEQMEKAGIDKIHDKNGLFTAKIALNPPSVNILNQSELPAEFVTEKTEQVIDKKSILKHFKSTGEVVSGVEIIRKKRLSIR